MNLKINTFKQGEGTAAFLLALGKLIVWNLNIACRRSWHAMITMYRDFRMLSAMRKLKVTEVNFVFENGRWYARVENGLSVAGTGPSDAFHKSMKGVPTL